MTTHFRSLSPSILTPQNNTQSDTIQYRQDGVRIPCPTAVAAAASHVVFRRAPADVTLHHSKEKMHINVVVIGHVDSGKSTTTGMTLFYPSITPYTYIYKVT